MRVAVVTPYLTESVAVLARCHKSVLTQSHPVTHFLVADGRAHAALNEWNAHHLVLSRVHGDGGCTPRAAGAASAFSLGFDAVALLDADNWLEENHVETLVDTAQRQGAAVAFSGRRIVLADGQPCPYEDKDVIERRHVDTSCHFVTVDAAWIIGVWSSVGPELWPLCDRMVLSALRQRNVACAWTGRPTVNYLSRWGLHYKAVGKTPPLDEHRLDWDAVKRRFEKINQSARFGPGLVFADLFASEHAVADEEDDRHMERVVRVGDAHPSE